MIEFYDSLGQNELRNITVLSTGEHGSLYGTTQELGQLHSCKAQNTADYKNQLLTTARLKPMSQSFAYTKY